MEKKISIERKLFKELENKEQESLKLLTESGGGFEYSLNNFIRKEDQENEVLLAKNIQNSIVGWSMFWKTHCPAIADATSKCELYNINYGLFIDYSYRKLGIGTRLMLAGHEAFGNLSVYESDDLNLKFFKKQKKLITSLKIN